MSRVKQLLDVINSEIDKQRYIQNTLDESSQEYRDSLMEETRLLEQKKVLIGEIDGWLSSK